MKKLFLIIIFSAIVFARENPFVPTQTFLELKNQDQNISSTIVEHIKPNIDSNDTNISVVNINHSKIQAILPTKEIFSYKPLDGVVLILNDSKLDLKVDKKYKLLQQIISDDKTKFVFDFEGKRTFYTIREKLNNKYFTSYTLGTHIENNFFRVVIKVKKDIKHFSILQTNSNIITIKYIKK